MLCYAKSLQLCPTLCNPIDGSPPGSPIPGILQARTLEWVAISFSNAWKWKVKVTSLSHARLLATPWTAAHQAPPSMGFSRQECWSGVPLPSPLFSSLHPSYLKMLLHCLAYIVSHEKYADSAFCSSVYNMPVFSLATFFFRPLSMQDLSSQIRDGIRIPCFGNLES